MTPAPARMLRVAIFANVSQPPFNNNLQPPVDAFNRVASVRLVEPHRHPAFVPTGAASPAEIPSEVAQQVGDGFDPHVVVVIGGAMFLSRRSRDAFPADTRFVGVALSDPLGLDASLAIAPSFDRFYTQDPQTLPVYRQHGIDVRRCDLAVDVDAVRRVDVAVDTDVVFVGKWTAYRDRLVRILAERCRVRIHTHRGESRWSVPAHGEVDTPELLSRAFSRSRLAVDFALIEQPGCPFDGGFRLTPRPQFAAACGVPSLVETFPLVAEMFEPRREIVTFGDEEELLAAALDLLADDDARQAIGRAALKRVRETHTWDHRVRQMLGDLRLEISP